MLRPRPAARVLGRTLIQSIGEGRYKHAPETYISKEGETALFQFGEGLAELELPEGTRVIYPGKRARPLYFAPRTFTEGPCVRQASGETARTTCPRWRP